MSQFFKIMSGMLLCMGLTVPAVAVLPTVTLDPNNILANSSVMALPGATMLPTSANSGMVTTASPLQQRLLASVVGLDAAGREVLTPITTQTPLMAGQIIEYRGYVINAGTDRVRQFKLTFDLPANVELTSVGDIKPNPVKGSMDGIGFHYMPIQANLGAGVQPIPMSYYKALQWQIEGLGLNEVAEVSYRVRVK